MADKEIGEAIDAAEVVTSRAGNGSDEPMPPLIFSSFMMREDRFFAGWAGSSGVISCTGGRGRIPMRG